MDNSHRFNNNLKHITYESNMKQLNHLAYIYNFGLQVEQEVVRKPEDQQWITVTANKGRKLEPELQIDMT